MYKSKAIVLSEEDRSELERRIRSQKLEISVSGLGIFIGC